MYIKFIILLYLIDKAHLSAFKVWVDVSGARKKMKLNRGRYQQLSGDSSLDEQTLHGIQTGIDSTVSL